MVVANQSRKTPISFLYKVVWKYIPNGIAYCDDRLLGGRFLRRLSWFGNYVWNENHPLVLVSVQYGSCGVGLLTIRRFSLRAYWLQGSSHFSHMHGLGFLLSTECAPRLLQFFLISFYMHVLCPRLTSLRRTMPKR